MKKNKIFLLALVLLLVGCSATKKENYMGQGGNNTTQQTTQTTQQSTISIPDNLENPILVTGVVKSLVQGLGVSDADVLLISEGGETEAITDSSGMFEAYIEYVEGDYLLISVSKSGYYEIEEYDFTDFVTGSDIDVGVIKLMEKTSYTYGELEG